MKRLYLSDVDGTLTRGIPYPTEHTIETIKKMIKQGLNFTVATGRSLSSVLDLYADIEAKLPAVVLNGSLVYDINAGKPAKIFSINKDIIGKIFEAFGDSVRDCRLYVYSEEMGQLLHYRCDKTKYPYSQKINPRTGKKYEDIIITDDIPSCAENGEVLYIGQNGTKERILKVYQQVINLEGVQCTFQSDPYNDDNFYIDIFSDKAGKSEGALAVGEMIGADELITFGDNANDVCMLQKADRSYAVTNAAESAKNAAKQMLHEDTADAVANFIADEFYKMA